MNSLQRQKLLLITAGLCFAAYAGDKLVVGPMIETWKTRTEGIADYSTRLEKGQVLLDRSRSLRERAAKMRALSLPADKTAAENKLLTLLGEWAATSRLGVTALRPRWVEDEELGRRLEIRISATGDLEKISRFVHALESDALPLRVDQMELRARDDKGAELMLETQVSSVMLAEATP